MSESKEKLGKILQKLLLSGDVKGAALITRDGLLIASELSQGINGDVFAAMSATMAGAAETVIQELNGSFTDRIIVESKNMKLITIGAGSQEILACITVSTVKLGLVLLEMNKTVASIKKM
jgi:uncharacterized protein